MFALRRLALAPPRASSPPPHLRAFASAPKKRLTWRQKAKLDERRRHPPAPRQPRRQNSRRPNFLISPPLDDGRNWRILSAGIVERLAIIQPDVGDWEMDFEVLQHEKALREDQRLEDGFWFMEPGARHVTPEEVPGPDEQDDPDELVGAGFHLAPRETEDDAMNNRKSLNRALKGRVFLLVKRSEGEMEDEKSVKYSWFFPVGAKMDGEKMRDAANRHVHETVGDEMRTAPMGFGPMGYVKYLHEEKEAVDGTKVFFYKSQLLGGEVALNQDKAVDYVWVTRDELAEYLDPEIADYIYKIVPP
uniref:Nudix hydrolase domain-containing protein n=1 Tax=Peronospora matthiolae TaxID=2874970 RepID=A0AAV1TN52_9STRA